MTEETSRKTTRLSRAAKPVRRALTKSDSVKPGKRPAGRPKGKKKQEEIDLAFLKQEMLLDDVSSRIEEKQRAAQQGIKEMVIPYTPSQYQQEVHELLEKHRFGVVIVHRGFGKTWLAANELIRRAWSCTAPQGGKFIYVAPEKLQAKKIVWGQLKYFVRDLPHSANEAELIITFPNGSVVELAGADNPDRLRGVHPFFIVMDEVAQMTRDTWYEAVYPSLRANRGGALFIGTPKGDSLLTELYNLAGDTKGWFHYQRDVTQTTIFTPEEVEELKATMPAAKFQQEYMCRADAAFTGAYYAQMIADLRLVTVAKYDPSYPVITGWDLGTADPTVIWFAQLVGNEIKLIDYYENNNKDFFHFLGVVKDKPYMYGYHILPHDVNNRGWEAGKSRKDYFKQHNMRVVDAPKTAPEEGIAVTQAHLYRCAFDADSCRVGIRHLMQYCSKKDPLSGRETGVPAHNGSQHAADAFRTLIMGLRKPNTMQSKFEHER